MSKQATVLNCLECKIPIEIFLPTMEIIEANTVSQITWAHPDIYVCPRCSQGHQMFIAGLNGVNVGLRKIQTKEESRLILAPANALKM